MNLNDNLDGSEARLPEDGRQGFKPPPEAHGS
ncbi:MAG: hypothetical protein N838_23460 [Thiohalocapsa sp. PB-PSB1]|jgi:hypothetical protein|nr:MAG: hypothetical protein N838_23460 [Thiohalocapsa sp. PB-PSB1]